MAIVLTDILRTAQAAALNTALSVGTTDVGGDLVIRTSGDVDLLIFTFQSPAFTAGDPGVMAAAGAPLTTVGLAIGEAAKFVLRNRDNAVILTGTVTLTGDGGDLEMDNLSVAVDQEATLPSLTVTMPA